MPAPAPHPPSVPAWRSPRALRTGGPAVFLASLIVLFLALASIGLPQGVAPTAGMIAATSAAVGGLITPTLYLLAGFGLGRPLAVLLARSSTCRLHLQLILGIGAMLWLSHLLGMLGLLSESGRFGALGARAGAWGSVGLGLLLLGHQIVRGELRPERWPVFPIGLVLWTPALALLAAAAANPPLGLWQSEFGGYDALSYHLQLAKEWAAGPGSAGEPARLWPVTHNVYSFLPSYFEGAFTHLAALTVSGGGTAIARMFGEQSHWVYACQYLHAGMGLVAALLVSRLVCLWCEQAGAPRGIAAFSGAAGGALLLSTPWTTVVGSLAYNELAMIAAGAGAMLAAADPALGPARRGLIAGALVGIACSAKPTALLLIGPAVGLALVAWPEAQSPRRCVVALAAAAAGGIAAIAPWLVRNALASGGNPVFPFAAARLGRGHWTDEQVARYARAHTTDLSVSERLWLLVSPRGGTSNGIVTGQARGLGHEQWSIVPWIALASLVVVLLWRPTRRVGSVLWIGALLTLLAWGAFTHIQSRFLMPLLIPMSAAFGIGAGAVLVAATRRVRAGTAERRPPPPPLLAAAVIGVLPLTIAGWSAVNFMRQYQAMPNRLLVIGAAGLSGTLFEPALTAATPEERADYFAKQAQPPEYVNFALREAAPGERGGGRSAQTTVEPQSVYLLGESAPLYYLDALGSTPDHTGKDQGKPSAFHVIYHTTWDASLLGDAIDNDPDHPAEWTRWMRDRGFGYVLVNYTELVRLIETDHNFDPRITGERIRDWLAPNPARPGATGVVSLRKWTTPADPAGRQQFVTHELFRIEAPGTTDEGAGTP